MDLERIQRVYLLGIGGIGMSALALYFHNRGIQVAGYDKTPTRLTEQLINEGIPIHFIEDIHQIPFAPDLVVYTPALPSDHKELMFLKGKGYLMFKRSEVLGMLTKGKYTIAVAGTHGKTTITSLITHLLLSAGIKVTAFIGGISRNYNTNLVDVQGAELMIAEADEYDRSFLQLEPDIAVISAMDADHLDIYGSYENMVNSYKAFAGKVKPGGYLVVNDSILQYFNSTDRTLSVSLSSGKAPFTISGLRTMQGLQHFDLHLSDKLYRDLVLGIPGHFNLENALLASVVASLLGVDEPAIRQSLRSFAGVERRFDFRIRTDQLVYIDDYAHHPRELSACIQTTRELYPDRKITGIFQPHLYSRTFDFAGDFAVSLAQLDEVILLDIYPAREKPIQGVTSDMLLDKIRLKNKSICRKDNLLEELNNRHLEVLLSLGAGDIDQLVGPIESMLKEKLKKK